MNDTPAKFDDKAFLKTLTHQPGVYRMLNDDATILYVGKAKNLKKRVSSYFNRSGINPRINQILQQVTTM